MPSYSINYEYQILFPTKIVRTKHIDEEMKTALATNSIDQVCVLGAGLDSRAWRLKMSDIYKDSIPTTAIRPTTSKIGYFEIDFPELFNYKLSVLANVCADMHEKI